MPVGSKLLLIGDDHVAGLAPPLARLCKGKRVSLHVRKMPVPVREGEMAKAAHTVVREATKLDADVVLVSLPWPSPIGSDELWGAARTVSTLRRPGKAVAWLRGPHRDDYGRVWQHALGRAGMPLFRTDALALPMGPDGIAPTVEGYAGWAGALWRWLR